MSENLANPSAIIGGSSNEELDLAEQFENLLLHLCEEEAIVLASLTAELKLGEKTQKEPNVTNLFATERHEEDEIRNDVSDHENTTGHNEEDHDDRTDKNGQHGHSGDKDQTASEQPHPKS